MLFARAILVLAASWEDIFSGSPCLTKMSASTPPELLYLPIAMITGGEPAHLASCDWGFQKPSV